ncbi:hypothetical protein, partial [Lentzea aerocolonigenes]|uniref:hypothetical protein n=1 Tax=Lentzea aerocolonigenes TaxID=68170 RepID=UPI0020A33702
MSENSAVTAFPRCPADQTVHCRAAPVSAFGVRHGLGTEAPLLAAARPAEGRTTQPDCSVLPHHRP